MLVYGIASYGFSGAGVVVGAASAVEVAESETEEVARAASVETVEAGEGVDAAMATVAVLASTMCTPPTTTACPAANRIAEKRTRVVNDFILGNVLGFVARKIE